MDRFSPSAFLPISAVFSGAFERKDAGQNTAEIGRNAEGGEQAAATRRSPPRLLHPRRTWATRCGRPAAARSSRIPAALANKGAVRGSVFPLCVSSYLCGVLFGVLPSERSSEHRRDRKKRRGRSAPVLGRSRVERRVTLEISTISVRANLAAAEDGRTPVKIARYSFRPGGTPTEISRGQVRPSGRGPRKPWRVARCPSGASKKKARTTAGRRQFSISSLRRGAVCG